MVCVDLVCVDFDVGNGDLLSGAHGRDEQVATSPFLAVALVVLVEQREGAVGGRGRAGEFRG
jgi:hypothetical protein